MDTGLDISFGCPAGNFIWVFAHVEVEEWKGGVVSHEQAQGGVKVGPIPLARYRPAPELHTETAVQTEGMYEEYIISLCPVWRN